MVTKITTDGNVGKSAELKTSPSGVKYVSVSIGHSESKKIGSGYQNVGTTWFNVSIFGADQEIADMLCAGAKRVLIVKDASLLIDSYAKRDGTTGISYNVTCNKDQIEIKQGMGANATNIYPAAGYTPASEPFPTKQSAPAPMINEPTDMPF